MTHALKIKSSTVCEYAAVSLGEVMLRLDPGDRRIRTTRVFDASEGGGEYNVIRGLRKVFGLKTAVITALVDNEIGKLVEDLVMQGGVDTRFIKWVDFDGIGRKSRNGLNFTERGFGVRGAIGVSDRGHTAVSQLKSEDIDWNELFSQLGVRWLHTGGIYAGLSDTTPEVIEAAMIAAKRNGTIISYDLNYRPSLWKNFGGKKKAQEINCRLASYVDVMIGNEEDFIEALGFQVKGIDENFTDLNLDGYSAMFTEAAQTFPNIKIIATTLRSVTSASRNDWSAIAWSPESGLVQSRSWKDLEIFDRVGGGDSFASGLIYGLMSGHDLQKSLNLGAAHGAFAMTTPGDTSMATKSEVEKLASGGSARVQR